MNEKYLFTEQIDRLSKSAPGLTSLSQGGYAVYGEIFMAETTSEKVESVQEAGKTVAEPVNRDELNIANELTAEAIQVRLNNNSSKLSEDEKVMQETKEDAKLMVFLQTYGITPEQFKENPDFYRKNRELFKNQLSK